MTMIMIGLAPSVSERNVEIQICTESLCEILARLLNSGKKFDRDCTTKCLPLQDQNLQSAPSDIQGLAVDIPNTQLQAHTPYSR